MPNITLSVKKSLVPEGAEIVGHAFLGHKFQLRSADGSSIGRVAEGRALSVTLNDVPPGDYEAAAMAVDDSRTAMFPVVIQLVAVGDDDATFVLG
jgi:hypothetical protein